MIINWKLYEDKKTQLSKSVSLIFYLIGSADGAITDEEILKLEEIVKLSVLHEKLGGHGFDIDMRDARDLFRRDFAGALETTKNTLAEFKGDKNISEFLIAIAQQLIVADEHLHEREELAMKLICEYLDHPPA